MSVGRLARLTWGVCTLFCVWNLAAVGADLLLHQAGPLVPRLLLLAYQALLLLGLPLETGLILTRQPRDLIGWLLLGPMLTLPTSALANAYLATFPTAPVAASLPFVLLVIYTNFSWLLLVFPLLLIPIFFPTGRPPSRRWWWVVGALAVHAVILLGLGSFAARWTPGDGSNGITWSVPNPIGFLTEAQAGPVVSVWIAITAVLTLVCGAALFVRYRQSNPVVRTQIRWLLYACGLFVLVQVPQPFLPLDTPTGEPTTLGVWINFGFAAAILAIPAAIAIAILRYRLWDIDVIIRRTLVYTVLSALLALAYFGSVLVLQSVFQAVTGESRSALVTVFSTLLIAALFGPLRGRVQRAIDRRFYRQKYDAARTLAAFGAQARDVVALDQLSEQLVSAVDETMQPAHAALWLMPKGRDQR